MIKINIKKLKSLIQFKMLETTQTFKHIKLLFKMMMNIIKANKLNNNQFNSTLTESEILKTIQILKHMKLLFKIIINIIKKSELSND